MKALAAQPLPPLGTVVAVLIAFGHALPAVGSGDSLARAALELEPPRIRGVWRTLIILTLYGGFVTVASTFLFVSLVPPDAQRVWADLPLLGITQHLPGPSWAGVLSTVAVIASATLLLGQAVRAGISGAERMLAQLAQQGGVTRALTVPHARLGTLARAIDTAAGVAVLAILASAGRVEWLAHAYAACLVWTLILKVTVLIRLRRPARGRAVPRAVQPHAGARRVALRPGRRLRIVAAATWLAMVVSGDPADDWRERRAARRGGDLRGGGTAAAATPAEEVDPFRLVSSQALTLEQVDARPGGVLVAVRNPNSLAHFSHALNARRAIATSS